MGERGWRRKTCSSGIYYVYLYIRMMDELTEHEVLRGSQRDWRGKFLPYGVRGSRVYLEVCMCRSGTE